MKHLPIIVIMCIATIACSKQAKQEDYALQAAKAYYDQLVQGDFNSFVDGTWQRDSLPQDYKAQLSLNIQQYLENIQKEHKGINHVEALRAKCDTLKLANDSSIVTAQAFLALCFNDSTREEIVVPMVLNANIWYLR